MCGYGWVRGESGTGYLVRRMRGGRRAKKECGSGGERQEGFVEKMAARVQVYDGKSGKDRVMDT